MNYFDPFDVITDDDLNMALGQVPGLESYTPLGMNEDQMANLLSVIANHEPGIDVRHFAWGLAVGITAEKIKNERISNE